MHSSYYPPRARRWLRWPLSAWWQLKQWLRWDRLFLRWLPPVTLSNLALCLLVPGAAYWVAGWKRIGCGILAGYLLGWLVFLAFLGYPAANVAWGLMISAHASSAAFFLIHWLQLPSLWSRLAVTFTVLLAVSVWQYMPLRSAVSSFALPIRINGQVIVVNCLASPQSIHRGDRIVYTIRGLRERGIYLQDGFGYERVLAMPGDQVRFHEADYEVNHARFPSQSNMPLTGEIQVPKSCWFVWPELIIMNWNQQTDLTSIYMKAALVSERQLIGTPFRHWFGRRQQPP